jgi:hypothetical protein
MPRSMGEPAIAAFPTRAGRSPFAQSASIATANHPQEPVVRRTFIAPTLPVPCWVMSVCETQRTMRYAHGIDPTAYENSGTAISRRSVQAVTRSSSAPRT